MMVSDSLTEVLSIRQSDFLTVRQSDRWLTFRQFDFLTVRQSDSLLAARHLLEGWPDPEGWEQQE